MSINSRQKGARGERLFAKLLREHGYKAERGCQHAGGKDSPDVKSNMPQCHWEVKCVEKLNLDKAMEQSVRDAGDDEMALVAHKKNRHPWLVTMSFDEWIELYKAWERERLRNKKTKEEVDPRQMDWAEYEERISDGDDNTD